MRWKEAVTHVAGKGAVVGSGKLNHPVHVASNNGKKIKKEKGKLFRHVGCHVTKMKRNPIL